MCMIRRNISPIDVRSAETRRHLHEYLTGPVLAFVARACPERILTAHRPLDRRRPGRDLLIPRSQVGHSHAHVEISVLLEGQCAMGVGDEVFELTPGDWTLHAPHVQHFEAALPNLQPFRQIWFTFLEHQADLSTNRYDARRGWELELWFEGQPGRFRGNPRQMIHQLALDLETAQVSSIRAALLDIVHHFVREIETAPLRRNPGIADPLVRRTLLWMDREPPTRHALPLAARALGCSPATLTRRFKHTVGCSFAQFVRKRRLEHTRHLLLTTSLTLASIADRCGFTDDSHLSRLFRADLGCTPKQFREGQAHAANPKQDNLVDERSALGQADRTG